MTPEPRKIDRYEITRELGRGGMGIVYEAIDPRLRRKIAIKVLNLQWAANPGQTRELKERLLREARAVATLSHPGIVTVFDVDEDAGVSFIAMELVNGPTLDAVLRANKRLATGSAIDLLAQIAVVLDYAHLHGVVHRDIKPANIMLREGRTVKVADFGIARQMLGTQHTRTGMILGTFDYMSPEQCEGRAADGKSDQFSLAVIAFEMLTGTNPFASDSIAVAYHRLVVAPRPSAQALAPDLPQGTDEVLARGLAQDAQARYPNCVEFVAALESVVEAERAPRPFAATMPEYGLRATQVTPQTTPLPQPTPPPITRPPAPRVTPPPPSYQHSSPRAAGSRTLLCVAGILVILGIAMAVWLQQSPSAQNPAQAVTVVPAATGAPRPEYQSPGPLPLKPAPGGAAAAERDAARAEQLLQQGEYAAAIASFRLALASEPGDARASAGLKRALAAKAAEAAMFETSEMAKAEQFLQQGDYAGAIASFKLLLASDPNNARALSGLKQATDAKAAEDGVFGKQ